MKHDLVVIGASLGGLRTLEEVLFKVPDDFQAPVLITNHFTEQFDLNWVDKANTKSQMDIQWAKHDQLLHRGNIYVAPPDKHLIVTGRRRVELSDAPPVLSCRPAIDPFFESAAKTLKSGLLAILLTGLNKDGSHGSQIVKQHGGTLIIQDPKTAIAKDMPESALKHVEPDHIFSPKEIYKYLLRFNRL